MLLLAGLAVACLVGGGLWSGLLSEGRLDLLGAPGGELWGHAWVQWWHGEDLPSWPSGPGDRVPGDRDWPVIDPLPTALAAVLSRAIGAVAAYDLVMLVGVFGAFLGGAWLARLEDGDPWIGGLSLALAPSFLGTLASGLTEDLALGLAAVGLGLVGRPEVRRALLGGACLGVLASCGLVLAWASGMVAVGLGLWALVWHAQRRKVAMGLVAGALTAGVLALPPALLQGARLGGEGHRSGGFSPRFEPLWRLNPWKGVDLASFFVPGRVDPGDALVRMHPGYLGLSLLLLALCGGKSRWWLVLLVAMLMAPGLHLSWMGEPLGMAGPAHVLRWLPFGELINHHGRLMLMGAVALSVLAARGAVTLSRRAKTPWLRGVLLLAVGLDLGGFSPVATPLPTADARPLAVYVHTDFDSLPQGAVLQLPAAGPGIHFQRPLYDQRAHRRPLVLDPNRPGLPPALARTDSGRFLASLAAPDPAAAPDVVDWPAGVALVVVAEPHVDRVVAAWGTPTIRAVDSAVWSSP